MGSPSMLHTDMHAHAYTNRRAQMRQHMHPLFQGEKTLAIAQASMCTNTHVCLYMPQVPDSLQGPDPELHKLYRAAQALAAGGPSSHPGVAALAAEVLEGLAPLVL